jgi:hypothetical protein
MTDAKHTPGPWWERPRAVEYAADVEHLKANATELLAALREVSAYGCDLQRDIMEQVRAAIAKAEGKE